MDMWRDPFQEWLEKSDNWIKVVLVSWAGFFALGFGIAVVSGEGLDEAVRLGASVLVWLGAVRIVYGWHTSWAVNSLSHAWGYRRYESPDASRNNVIIGLLTSGEGWHNNHHADPASARHGHAWWEFDLAWVSIRLLEAVGLAWDVKRPSPEVAAQFGRQPAG
jgi:stearoyl-CoA desaturase (delta-9 desaturase)